MHDKLFYLTNNYLGILHKQTQETFSVTFFMFNELVHLEHTAISFFFFFFNGKSYNMKGLDSKEIVAGVGQM